MHIPHLFSNLSLSLVFVLIILLFSSKAGKLPIQAHSFNDLAYTSNLIKKGIDYFKLDISMANRKSCSQHSSWNSSQSCLKTKQYIEDICCLALRGDASSRPHFTADFSTSDDLIEFLKRQMAQIVVKEPKRKLLFAINFQYNHFFQDPLTQGFLSKLVDIMTNYPDNLLIGTGSDSFILEYDRICFAKSTSCTQIRKKISNSKIFLQSSSMQPFDSRDHYKRFRNFNVFYKQIQRFCSTGFPEWIDKYPEFPLIFWEPSNEQQIQYVFNTFTSPSCMKQHGRNISGMAMAINIDSQMFDFYLKKTIEPIVFNNWLLPYKTEISVSNISFLSTAQKVIFSEQENMRITKIKNSRYETIFVASQNVFTHKLLLQKWDFDELSGYTKLVQNQQFTNILADDEKIISLMQDGLNNLVIMTVNEKANKSRGYYFRSADFFQITAKDLEIVKAVVMRGDQIVYVACDKTDTSCKIKGTQDLKEIKEYANVDISLFLSKVTSIVCNNKTSFILAGQSARVTDGAALVMISQGKVYPTSMQLTLGHNPKIFRKESGRQFGVILEDSMCHSALLINNNGMNKCSFFNDPSYKSLRNVQGLVNLLEFNLQDILGNQAIISPCHPKIFLTKLMNAKNPDILQFPTLGSYFIASQYLRVEDQDITSALFCGGSNFEKKYKYYQRSSMLGSIYLSNKN